MAAALLYEVQLESYSCVPACVSMILRRCGHPQPDQQQLIDWWCVDDNNGDPDEANWLAPVYERRQPWPISWGRRTAFPDERGPDFLEMLGWLEQQDRWIVAIMYSQRMACLARLKVPSWSSRWGAIFTLSDAEEANLDAALRDMNSGGGSQHAIVLTNHRDGWFEVLDPFHDQNPVPVYISADEFEQASLGNFLYPLMPLSSP